MHDSCAVGWQRGRVVARAGGRRWGCSCWADTGTATRPPAPRTEYDAPRSWGASVRTPLWLLPVPGHDYDVRYLEGPGLCCRQLTRAGSPVLSRAGAVGPQGAKLKT